MIFSDNLLIGAQIVQKDLILKMLLSGTKVYDIYLIMFKLNSNNLIEIIKSNESQKQWYKDGYVFAICSSKAESKELTKNIIDDFIKTTSDFKEFKTYLQNRFFSNLQF